MLHDTPRLLELLAESLIRQDQLLDLIQDLRTDHRILHDKFDTQDSNFADLLRRLERIELRQDQQQQLLRQLLEVFAGPGATRPTPAQQDRLDAGARRLLGGTEER